MSWYLFGSGRRPRSEWSRYLALDGSWTASWADHNGFHQEGIPAEPPRTTHLWAWAHHRWLRVRVEHDAWWAALLTEGLKEVHPLWTNPVDAGRPDITRFRNWGRDRTARQYRGTPGVLDRTDMIQLVPLRQTTAAFIGDAETTSAAPHPS